MRKKICRLGVVFGLVAACGLSMAAEQISPGSGLRKQRKVIVNEVYKLVKSDVRCVAEAFYDSGYAKPLALDGFFYLWRQSQATYQERTKMTLRFTIQHLGLSPAPPTPPSPGRATTTAPGRGRLAFPPSPMAARP